MTPTTPEKVYAAVVATPGTTAEIAAAHNASHSQVVRWVRVLKAAGYITTQDNPDGKPMYFATPECRQPQWPQEEPCTTTK